jgi:hypothetical protein
MRTKTITAAMCAMVLATGLGTALTTTPASASARTRASAAYRRSRPAPTHAAAPSSRLQQVKAIADSSGWDWRAAGVSYVVGFHPEACCHWGIFDSRTGAIYIGPTAFGNAARLRYVVLHETAHAWQYRVAPTTALMGDYGAWGYSGANALEAGADCIANVWGATGAGHYWRCPPKALAVAARELGRP